MTQTQSAFLQNVALAAQQSQRQTGVPASVTIAQAVLESSWGLSGLAKQANNFFGIKATAAAVPADYVELETEEFVDGREVKELARFARYASPLESFQAHGRLLSTSPRYAPAMAVKGDPEAFAYALWHAGYSTNPYYPGLLVKLIREFDLTQYDLPEDPAKEQV